MDKVIFFFILFIVFANCKNKETQPIAMQKVRSWEEVIVVAAQYGLADTFRNKMATENGLMYFTEKGLQEHFKKTKHYFEINNQRSLFIEESKNINNLSDYFKLFETLPLFRIEYFKSEEKYEAFKNECIRSESKFFIHDDGFPYLIVASKSEEMPAEKARPISNR